MRTSRFIQTNQKTFGKATKMLLAKSVPNARKLKRFSDSVLIYDADDNYLGSWMPRKMANGVIVIHRPKMKVII